MLVIKIELHPHGRSDRARELGRMTIVNVGGSDEIGDYEIKARDSRRIGHPAALVAGGGILAESSIHDVLDAPDRTGRVTGHARLTEPVWSLLAKALGAIGFGGEP